MKKLFLVVTLIAVVIAGACLLTNPARKEIDQDIPVLTITTPRDLFSPFMSSMFGFELVVNAPGEPAIYTYACDKGTFCTYKDAKVTHQGNNLTTAEKVYWTPVEDGEYVYSGEMDKILITITALDQEKKAIARGTAAIEHDPEGGWFKFTGEAAASQSLDETPDPVQGIKK
ncbi:MAG: hypothetical protein ACOX6Z_00735 [Dethiobacteria bacterium]|jgi:hypothetical protein